MPHTEARWTAFVQSFTADIASYLNINASRVSIRQKDGDALTDIVIKSNVDVNNSSKLTGPTPEKLAHQLKSVWIPNSGVKGASPRLIDAVNTGVKPQIIPLVIPTNVNPLPPLRTQPKQKTNKPDCEQIRKASMDSCGAAFKCSKQC